MQPDGYLDTYYIIGGLDKRWTNLRDNHELYCAGHLIEAAVAYFQATGKDSLLNVALRLVKHIDDVIGPEEGKLHGYPGHPIIEMALMRLYGVTQDPLHFRLARYLIDQRGQAPLYFDLETRKNGESFVWKSAMSGYRYYQAHRPLREQQKAVGHAVRAVYLYSGMADVARETGDGSLIEACHRLWQNLTEHRMYVTGAIGSSEYGEGFTLDDDLPNNTVYGETCASIGLVFFARRMLRLEARGEYADVMELALYNGVLSGMQLDGKRFFYVNPLEVDPAACAEDYNLRHVKPERQKWFGCACCPPNIIRLLASLENYVSDIMGETLFLHLYMSGKINWNGMTLQVETRYPWEGNIRITVHCTESAERTFALRIPGWCHKWQLQINGEEIREIPLDGYVCLKREWHCSDRIDLNLDMPSFLVRAHPRVKADAGKAALQRGPLIYCLEEADNGPHLHALRHRLPLSSSEKWEPDLLDGVTAITTAGFREKDADWQEGLYSDTIVNQDPVLLRWIPYYAWANRGLGEMCVWVRA